MRLPAALILLPLIATAPLADGGTASVAVTGEVEASFTDGHAYVLALDGFAVLALATHPLVDGSWQREGEPFGYVEVRLMHALEPGTYTIGEQAAVTYQMWGADDEMGPSAFFEGGTLTITAVENGVAQGTITASADGTSLQATFSAVPGNIPSP